MMTIEQAIARVPRCAVATRLSVTPLAEGITNLNFRVEADGETFIVRIAGRDTERLGIDRRRECRCAIAAGRTGVGPDVVECLPDEGILVTRFISGRHLSAEDMARPEILGRVVRSLHGYHMSPPLAGRFSPFRIVEEYLEAARAFGAPLPADIGWLSGEAAAIETAGGRGTVSQRLCHNDLWGPNLIDDGERVRILDWEYAGMGDVYFDLANFAVHHAFDDARDEALLRAYFGAVSATGLARLKLLKIVAELREAMWAMVAVTLTLIAGTGFDCLEYAATHFDRCRRALGDPRLPSWLRAAALDG
jgi:thiamine kinase-like enzyme